MSIKFDHWSQLAPRAKLLLDSGMSIKECAIVFDVSPSTVRRWVRVTSQSTFKQKPSSGGLFGLRCAMKKTDNELRALAEAAAKPWGLAVCDGSTATGMPSCGLWVSGQGPRTMVHDRMVVLDPDDARFISAASPEVVLSLLDRLAAAERARD